MNTIKFRGKSLSTGEWVYGNLITYQIFNREVTYIVRYPQGYVSTCGNTLTIVATQVDPKTVGQYIGLLDSKEREVYTDDIIKTHELIDVVVWREDLCGYSYKNDKSRMNIVDWFDHGKYSDPQIIGNIHSNPDLLTQ